MNKLKIFPLLLLLFILSVAAVQADSDTASEESHTQLDTTSLVDASFDPLTAEHQIVRAYYTDPAMIATIAKRYDMLETEWDQEAQYVLVDTSSEDRAALLVAGFELHIDTELTLKLRQESQAFVRRRNASMQAIPGFSCYRTVEETLTTGATIAADYPNLAEWIDIGDSWQKINNGTGYDLMVLRLTNEASTANKSKVWYMSAVHAREYATAELNTRFAEYLVNNYGTDPDVTWVLDHHEVHLLLQANPDGRKVAETGKLYRKNGNENACNGINYYQSSSSHGGVDLNRNYSFGWGSCPASEGCSSNSMCTQTYRGTSGASEPEVNAIENYLRSIFPDQRAPGYEAAAPLDATGLYLDIHAYGELFLYPWGAQGNTGNNAQFEALNRKLAGFNGYRPQRSDELYPTDGTSVDFGYGELGVASMVLEIGNNFFQNCSTFENSIYPENEPMLMYAIKASRAPYQLPFGPEANNVTVSAPIVTPGSSVTLNAEINDTRYNNQNGTQPVQNVVAAEYYIDTPPWEAGAVAVPMSAADGNFNSTIEDVTASVSTAGLSNGKHLIFVRGQDADGNWGVMTAQFIEVDTDAPVYQTIFSDDFENTSGWVNDPDGTDNGTAGIWEIGDPQGTSSGSIVIQVENAASGTNALITQLASGSSLGAFDVDNGVVSIQSPAIALPNATALTMSLNYYLAHINNASSDDFFRISVVAGGNRSVVYQELGASDNDEGAWASATVDLTAFGGQTIQLLFSAADNSSFSLIEAGVDDIEIVATNSQGVATPTNTPIPINTPTPSNTPRPTNTPAPTPTVLNTPPPGIACTTYTSSDTPINLPNGTQSIASTLSVPSNVTISDLNLSIDMPHKWVGDLSFTLAHNGTSVVAVDRPGVPRSTYGCRNDDLLMVLDDEAAALVESQCRSTAPAINGIYRPNNALSAFDGAPANGSWTLTVADAYTAADAGTLASWSLEICTNGTNAAAHDLITAQSNGITRNNSRYADPSPSRLGEINSGTVPTHVDTVQSGTAQSSTVWVLLVVLSAMIVTVIGTSRFAKQRSSQ